LRIVASFYPIYLATLNVAGGIDGVEVVNLARPSAGCLHDYQLTPADLGLLARASVLVINGAGMESFLDKARRQAPGLRIINASEGIRLLPGREGENPHVWLSLSNALAQAQNIAGGLARLDPAHAPRYEQNAAAYCRKLEALRERLRAGLRDIRVREIVTFHEAFSYFAEEYNLKVVAVIAREPGSEPSARELAELIGTVKKTGVKALFAEPQYSAKAAETIARETGAKVHSLDPVVTGPLKADAYLTIMDQNLFELRKALQ
jgi:zinc transport system substrate-binding protein